MDTARLFERLALALAIGLLVGIERGWREREGGAGSRTAGIRTYGLIGLLGGIWAALVPVIGPWPMVLAGLAFAAAFAVFQYREDVARNTFSVTGTVAGLVVYALGAYAVLGNATIAVAAGVATTALLAARQNLHEFLRRLTWPELRSAVLLLAMSFLLLPVLPNRTVDPWNALNPREIWLMVILIAGLSFAGYAAVRVMGARRGLTAAAAAGALASSTAVTLNNAHLARDGKARPDLLAGGICLAWAISLIRMTSIACIVNAALIAPLGVPIAASALIFLIAAVYYLRAGVADTSTEEFTLGNPFDVGTVLGFGALLALVLLAAKLLTDTFGESGLLPLAGVSGLVDVDPVTLSTAKLTGVSIVAREGALAILTAAGANLLTKMSVAVVIGGARFGVPLVLVAGVAIAVGGIVWGVGGL